MSDVPDQSQPKGEKPPFQHVAFVVCENIIVDKTTDLRSLIGLASNIWTAGFPMIHHRIAVYAEMTNGHGAYDFGIRLVYAADDEIMQEGSGTVDFPDPRAVVNFAWTMHNIVFPKPGEYRFQLVCNGTIVVERRLMVLLRRPEERADE